MCCAVLCYHIFLFSYVYACLLINVASLKTWCLCHWSTAIVVDRPCTLDCPQDELSGADIKAMCTEAGLLALRERRMRVTHADFKKAREKVLYKKKEGVPEGLYL